MKVGVRELKANLSKYLDQASRGEEVVVTDRGRPIARITPFVADSTLERGIDEGWVDPPRRNKLGPPPLLAGRRSVLEVLDEDRG